MLTRRIRDGKDEARSRPVCGVAAIRVVLAAGLALSFGVCSSLAAGGSVDTATTGSVAAAVSTTASIRHPGQNPGQDAAQVAATTRSTILERQRRQSAAELQAVAANIELSQETVSSLDTEIQAFAADRDRIRQAMIDAAAAQKTISASLADTEGRIDGLAIEEGTIKASLRERRGVLAEVLAALERMGQKPPPALLVKPQDALGSVRSAILLGAVVPSIRKETEALAADLDRLASVRGRIVDEKKTFAAQITQHREEEARLAKLFDEKEKLEASSRERRNAESARAAELAGKAGDLKDLIASLQADVDSARLAEEASRKAAAEAEATRLAEAAENERRAAAERLAADRRVEAERQAAARAAADDANVAAADAPREADVAVGAVAGIGAGPSDVPAGTADAALQERDAAPAPGAAEAPTELAALRPSDGALGTPGPGGAPTARLTPDYDLDSLRREAARLEPAAAFSTMKGRLSKPVAGRILVRYGGEDDIGRQATGMSIEARAADVVTAPTDATVLYAGPFRSYGQLLILDAGDGYHVVLAGMDRIDVEAGQFVSAGEPVAVMGARRVASVAVAEFGALEPTLYVEFRKDGKPVDPSPWWMDEPSGRTRNDS